MSQPESLVSSFLYAILGFALLVVASGPATDGAILSVALVLAGVDALLGRFARSPIQTLARFLVAGEDGDADVGV